LNLSTKYVENKNLNLRLWECSVLYLSDCCVVKKRIPSLPLETCESIGRQSFQTFLLCGQAECVHDWKTVRRSTWISCLSSLQSTPLLHIGPFLIAHSNFDRVSSNFSANFSIRIFLRTSFSQNFLINQNASRYSNRRRGSSQGFQEPRQRYRG